MSNLQIIEELCAICEMQNRIIKAQSEALGQLGAAVMEEERETARQRLDRLLGSGEVPDNAQDLPESS